jgi:hypothetical protein
MHLNPLFQRLETSRRVLVAGAGGGFDVMSGLPIAFALEALGKKVFFANMTFTYLGATEAQAVGPGVYEVRADTKSDERYFPEKHLAVWLMERGRSDVIYAIEKGGAPGVRASYAALARALDIDAVVLVDGGTDILMRGDEAGLGTPVEDITSLLGADALDVPTKLVACVGFGVDAFHGVCHAHFLENVAALAREGAYHGVFALLPSAPEVTAWLDAVAFVQARTVGRESIVCASIADAVRGEFGDHHSVPRTRTSGTELFINPLMSLVWSFELGPIAARVLYRRALEHTQSPFEVMAVIEGFRHEAQLRPRRVIPA